MNWRSAALIISAAILSFTLAFIFDGFAAQHGFDTLGMFVVSLLPDKNSTGRLDLTPILYIFVADSLVWFGFLSSIRFLWRQGRRNHGHSTLWGSRLKLGAILIVAIVCALPLSYYVVQLKSRLHSGLADTPAEVTASFILSTLICATALCGIAAFGRFWPSAKS
jgi:hypothetical protein